MKQIVWKKTSAFALAAIIALGAVSSLARAQSSQALLEITGREVMERVNARSEGEFVTRNLTMELIDRRGSSRIRETIGYRRYYGDEKRTVVFFTSPANIRGTGFLTHDHAKPSSDDQWLYLPALRKVRRISESDRGDYFLGTDFTYEEIKKETKIEIDDYTQTVVGVETVEGVETYVVESIPVSDEIAEELGYSKVLSRIDPGIWMSRLTEFWDLKGNLLKTIHTEDIRQVDGIWTAHLLRAENHKTGHKTTFTFSNVDYASEVPVRVFEQSALRRGG